MNAICISCGTAKGAPWHKCRKCGLVPSGEVLVKSVYCSTGRFDGDEVRSEAYRDELCRMQKELRQGEEIEYDATDLKRLKEQGTLIDELATARVWGAVFRFFLPAIIFLAVIYTLLYIL